jgi:hypothetical protein
VIKVTRDSVLIEHCSQERQTPAKAKYDEDGNNYVTNHVLLVWLAGPTVVLRAAGIAFYKVE